MWRAPQKKLEQSVKLAGPYAENRLQALRTGVELFPPIARTAGDIRGPLPRRAGRSSRSRSWARPARTACCCLPPIRSILPVDARVNRVGQRLGYGDGGAAISRSSRDRSRTALTRELTASADAYRRAFLYLSHHGGATCTEATRTVRFVRC